MVLLEKDSSDGDDDAEDAPRSEKVILLPGQPPLLDVSWLPLAPRTEAERTICMVIRDRDGDREQRLLGVVVAVVVMVMEEPPGVTGAGEHGRRSCVITVLALVKVAGLGGQ